MLNYFDFYVFEITILGHLKNENLDFFIVFFAYRHTHSRVQNWCHNFNQLFPGVLRHA